MLIRRIVLLVLLLVYSLTLFADSSSQTSPLVGSLVQLIAPHLGSKWQYGMFNRLRIEPPCYRVIIFEPENNRVKHTLKLEELERLQVHSIYDGSTKPPPSVYSKSDGWDEKDWQEISLVELRKSNCQDIRQ